MRNNSLGGGQLCGFGCVGLWCCTCWTAGVCSGMGGMQPFVNLEPPDAKSARFMVRCAILAGIPGGFVNLPLVQRFPVKLASRLVIGNKNWMMAQSLSCAAARTCGWTGWHSGQGYRTVAVADSEHLSLPCGVSQYPINAPVAGADPAAQLICPRTFGCPACYSLQRTPQRCL